MIFFFWTTSRRLDGNKEMLKRQSLPLLHFAPVFLAQARPYEVARVKSPYYRIVQAVDHFIVLV